MSKDALTPDEIERFRHEAQDLTSDLTHLAEALSDESEWEQLLLHAIGFIEAATARLGLPVAKDPFDVEVEDGETVWDPLESTCRHASLSIL